MASLTLNDIQTEIFECCWPIGSIFITSSSENPSILLKGGTNSSWKKIEGRFLIGADNTYVIQTTGGESTVTLTQNQIPSHTHSNPDARFWGGWGIAGQGVTGTIVSNATWGTAVGYSREQWGEQGANVPNQFFLAQQTESVSSTGGNQPHNNIPPYYAVNIWERIE